MKNFFIHILKNIFPLVLLLIFGYLFFYRLDYNTLGSWDEAWYGSIAREMIKSRDWLKMVWNGSPYYDHPPMGFWLMAISYKFFGINELSTRLPSAILGLASILLIYATSIHLFGKKVVGFVSALILGASVWYVIRVRSGNLDSIFVFFYILTIYLSIKAARKFCWFPAMMASFGGLIMTKTLVGFSALILIIFYDFKQIIRIKKNWPILIFGLLVFFIIVTPWYWYHIKNYPSFIDHHFFIIGAREKTIASFLKLNAALPLFYLHMGVRKWYYLWLAGGLFLIISFKFIKKNIFFILLWNLIVLYPFLTTDKTHIWHLIPVYLPLALITASGIYYLGRFFFETAGRIKIKYFEFVYLLSFITVAVIQFKIFYHEVFPDNKYVPDDVAISKQLSQYKEKLFLDDDFLPIAVFYSGKNIQPLFMMPDDKKTLVKLFSSDEKNFVVVTRNWAVDNLKSAGIKYQLLQKNNSFSILKKI